MSNCVACGTPLQDESNFCGKCGRPVSREYTAHPSALYHGSNAPQEKKKRSGCLIAFFVVLGVIVGLFILLFAIGFIAAILDTDLSSNGGPAISSTAKMEEPSIPTKQEYSLEAKTYSYTEIARNPERYKGNMVRYIGEVIQVQESGRRVVLRVNVTKEEYEFLGDLYKDTVYVEYTKQQKDEPRILENDIVRMYGRMNGIKTYEAIFGNEVSIPFIKVDYIDILE